MIKKFKEIGNLAIFQDFKWDNSVLNKENNVVEFQQINILYGRNYSGKTTLSRILRAIERAAISEKFENPSFSVLFSDNTEISQNNLADNGKKIRVFNDDFVRDNLKFIINPEESIEPFAILGIDNLRIETEIKALEAPLGSNIVGEESGLYKQLQLENKNVNTAQLAYNSKKAHLNSQLDTKATSRETGIKYKAEKFGDQNYTIRKLETDIEKVLYPSFKAIASSEQSELEKLVEEKVNIPIPTLKAVSLSIADLNISVESLVTQKVSDSNMIEELVKDAMLNKWVKEGRILHKDKRKTCAFCDNEIKVGRWVKLEKHFDDKSEKLENSILQRLREIENKIALVSNCFEPNFSLFYTKFHIDINRIKELFKYSSDKYIAELISLKRQLEARNNDLLNPKMFASAIDYSKRISWIFGIYENLRQASNDFSSSLATEQFIAKEKLRLNEVLNFAITVDYSKEVKAIMELKEKEDGAILNRDKILHEINETNELIERKRRELKDESKGADCVNEYINDFFGHNFLSLRAVEYLSEGEIALKTFRFEVIRDGKKAYHLSEGEGSLIAFCYFMAKLEDIETKGVKPIIWIDDPISSLDGNHIFFVYSIINSEIVSKNIMEQLFVSTHSLDFLKYLKRLTGLFQNPTGNLQEYSKSYFVISRHDKVATISLMPKYLKEFVTEFNYLFHQIYKCSKIEMIDDTNYTTFYNFGNNARKFLEIYLYYKFPDNTLEIKKLQKFFGGEIIPSVFTDRINNEYSHLSAIFERGAIPVEVPEMKSAAELIIKRIKETDEAQYKSLLLSIGETPEEI